MSESREELRQVIEAALLLEGPNPEWASEQAEDVLDALVSRFGEPEWDYPNEKYRPYYRRLAFARWIDYAPKGKP